MLLKKLPYCLFLLFSIIAFQKVKAQNSPIRVTVQVLPPYSINISDYLGTQDKVTQRFQEQIIVTVQNNNPARPYEIKLMPSITGNNGLFAQVNENFQPFRRIIIPAGDLKVITGRELAEINQNLTENDITYQGFSRNTIERTGTLPEGNYQVCIKALDYRTNEELSSVAPIGCSPPIPIAFPDPPVIAYPFHQAEVLASEPQALNISWAPAPNLTSAVNYEVRIVELNQINANPYDLMEQTNISFYEERDIATTNLFYDQTKPPFKEGYTYAIRIRAYDPFGELKIKNNGLSEIHTFKYVSQLGSGESLADVDYIGLEPGFLNLVNLENLQVNDLGDSYNYNGTAQLEITTPDLAQPDLVQVTLNNLRVAKGNMANARILSGSLNGNTNQIPQALSMIKEQVELERLTWDPVTGLGIIGKIKGPDQQTYQAEGNLRLTQNGVFGSIEAIGDKQNPLFSLGESPVQLALTNIGYTFPNICQTFAGYLQLFSAKDEEEWIEINSATCSGYSKMQINAEADRVFKIDNGSGKLLLSAGNIFGTITPVFDQQSINYDLEFTAELGFENLDQALCGMDLLVKLNDASGVQVTQAGSNCLNSQNVIPLGPANFYYSDFSIDNLAYNSATNEWNFGLSLDGQFVFPVFGDFTTPTFENIGIDKNGILIPSMNFSKGDINIASPADWGDYIVTLEEFIQSPVTLPIFRVDKIGPGDWDFAIQAKVAFADKEGVPECLKGSSITIKGLNFGDNQMNGIIDPQDIGDCTWNFGAGYAMNFNSMYGTIGIEFVGDKHYPVGGELTVDFDFLFGQPFACEGQNSIEMLDSELRFKNGVSGPVEQIIPPCPLQIGPFKATVTKSTLNFEASKNLGQNVFLDGEAELDFKNLNTKGTFYLDLMTGKFKKLSFKITEPFELDIPSDDKVLTFRIEQAEINADGLLIDGRNQLLLGDQTVNATFDNLLLDLETGNIKSGAVIFDSEFGLLAAIDADNKLRFRGKPLNHQLSESPAVFMQLAGNIRIDSTGLQADGSADAQLNFNNLQLDSLEAIYKDDFSVDISPFKIRNGRVELYYKSQRIAYADASGFHPDMSAFGDFIMPERIPLPTEEIAYLQIKENNQLLVSVRADSMGNRVISSRPEQPVKLVIPALTGTDGITPSVLVDFNDLIIAGSNGKVIGGAVIATLPSDDPQFDMSSMGVPFTPEMIGFGVNENGQEDVSALFLRGSLNIFERELEDDATVVLGIQSDGHLRGSINLQGIDASLPLLEASDYLQLRLKNIYGSMDIPLLASQVQPQYTLNFDSDFEIRNGSSELVASADFSGRLQPNDFTVTHFDGNVNPENAVIDLDFMKIKLNDIKSLIFDYQPATGIDFIASLDTEFIFKLSNGEEFVFPLKNVELDNLNGFTFPAQDIHSGSVPGFDVPAINFGIFQLKPLAFRLPPVTFNWFDWQPGSPLNLLPKVDLELSFPDYQYAAPEFSQAKITFSDIGFENGVLTGSMQPFSFPGDGVELPLAGDLAMDVSEISGLLESTLDSLQGFAIDLKGKLKYPDFFEKQENSCNQSEITVGIDQNAHFTGIIENFTPCGKLERGPLTLQFNSSQLKFEYANNQQYASLNGAATATINRENSNPVTANGNIGLDLISGKLLNGSILLTGPFNWNYPETDSLFAFTVQTARLDTAGLVFNGSGSLKIGSGNSNLNYNDLTFGLNDGKLIAGDVRIQNQFALDINLNPVEWSLEDPTTALQVDPGLRLVMPADLLLDKNGLTVNDSSTASLSYGGQQYDLLEVDFDQFNLGFNPVQVKNGVADFFWQNENDLIRIAYYNNTGFHLDDGTNLIKAVIPDTLALPTRDIAYIVLRDTNGDLLVDVQLENHGKRINSNGTLPMVVSAFDSNNPISIDVNLTDVLVNDAFAVVEGSITADATTNPVDLSPYDQIPLLLQMLKYEKWQNQPYALYAKLKLKLPTSLDQVEVSIDHIKLGPNGFEEGVFSAGTFSNSYNPNTTPLTENSYENGAFDFAIGGAELEFSQNGNNYRFSGTIGSDVFNDPNQQSALLFYAANYDTQTGWEFNLDANHLPNLEMPMDEAELILDNLDVKVNNNEFEVIIDGRLTLTEVMGDDFEVTINGLTIGTKGLSLNSVNTNASQYLSLFNQSDNLEITDLDLSFENRVLFITMDGSLNFLERDLSFTQLKLGTDGSLSLGNANANLLNGDYNLLGNVLVLQEINLTTLNSKIALQALGEANLPKPFKQNDNRVALTVNHLGQSTVDLPDISISNIPAVDLAGFATVTLTDADLVFDPLNLSNTIFYASADLEINNSDGEDFLIQFGEANGTSTSAGISYAYGDSRINWNITNSPSFTFEKTFFKLSVSGTPMVPQNGGFGVVMDVEAALNFDAVGGSGRMEDMIISTEGLQWGNFAGATYSFLDIVDIEVGTFEYKPNGGTIDLQVKDGNTDGPEGAAYTTIQKQVDEYLDFSNPTGNALAISIGDPDGFSVGGKIKRILYYRSGDELYFNMQGLEVRLHDFAELKASVEYRKDDTGFLMRVAGAANITPPGQTPIGVAAVGKLATINNEFSMGIFVAVKGVPIPIIPAIIEINEIGGGFFYRAETQDLDMVLSASGYTPYQEVPWQDSNQEYDFAIIFYGGVGIIGGAGSGIYTFTGTTLMVISSDFMVMDAQFEMNNAPIEGGAYMSLEWTGDKYLLEAGGGVQLKDLGVVKGGLGVNFTAVKFKDRDEHHWAVTGGTNAAGGQQIELVEILKADANIIINPDGFLLDTRAEGGFDVWLISINGNIKTSVWYLKQQEAFGAYAEVGVEASVLGGLASLGGTAKGALIKEREDFLIYASLRGYVKVVGVFDGYKTVWFSISNDGFDGGEGLSGYEDVIADARNQADKLDEKAQNLLASLENAKNAVLPLNNETLAQSGQALFMASQNVRQQWGNQFIANEEKLMNPTVQVFYDMRNEIVNDDRPIDQNRANMLNQLQNAVQQVESNSNAVIQNLQQLKSSAIQWEAQSGELMANLQNPVNRMDTSWQADDQPPSFEIDLSKANDNISQSSTLKENIENLSSEAFKAAIDTTLSNIHKIESTLDGMIYSLKPSPTSQGQDNVKELSSLYQNASERARRFYGTQISYFWALHHWAKNKVKNYDNLTNFYQDGPLDQANVEILQNLGIAYSGPLYGSYLTITMGGISIVQGAIRADWDPVTYSDLSSTQQQTFKSGLSKDINTVADVIGTRRYLIQKMNPTIDNNSALASGNDLESKIKNYWNSNDFIEFIRAINLSSSEVYDMQQLGLKAIQNMAYQKADSLVTAADKVIGSLDSAHQAYTQIQDQVYLVKNDMLNNLYNMYDLYSTWAEAMGGDSLSAPVNDKIRDLEELLLAPKINKIEYLSYKGNNGFDRDLLLSWNAFHPYRPVQVGIVENSFQVSAGTSNSIYGRGFKSTGNEDAVYYHVFAGDSSEINKELTVRIRTRGPAGNTITRMANITVDLTPDAVISTGNRQAIVEDNTPPPVPMVSLNYAKNNSPAVNGEKYWSNNPNQIDVTVIATDNQSDIAVIEYKIGTTRGGSQVKDWTTARAGAALQTTNSSLGNLAKNFSVTGLNLQKDNDYYLTVRVSNGAGLTSIAREVSTPLRLDIDLPEQATRTFELADAGFTPIVFSTLSSFQYQDNYVTEAPNIKTPPASVNEAVPSKTVKWNDASDALSGIRGYEYVVSDKASASLAMSIAEEVAFNYKSRKYISLNGEPLSFTDTTYVHVWSVDFAGNRSAKALTFKVLPQDPSAPSYPEATIMNTSTALRIYLTKPSYDAESGIAGVQYAIGTTPGGTDVKGWNANAQPDDLVMDAASRFVLGAWHLAAYGNGNWNSGYTMPAPYYQVPLSGLPQGQPLYVQFRTINGQNMVSPAVITGPVIIDTSAPPSPSVTLSKQNGQLKIVMTKIRDDQSGISKVEFTARNKNQVYLNNSSNWREVSLSGIQENPFSNTQNLTWSSGLRDTRVGIRLTNGNGLQSTYWFDGGQYFSVVSKSDTTPINTNFNLNW